MVVKTKLVIVWNNKAAIYFRKVYERIKEESQANAEKVKDSIIKIVDNLANHPEKYPPDKFKQNNQGNFRALKNTPIG